MNKFIKVLVMGGGRSGDFPDERRDPDVEVARFADATATARRALDWQLSAQANA